MNAAVTIDFGGGTASAGIVRIAVEQAQVALGLNEGVATGIGGSFTNIAILAGAVSFATAAGGTFGGTLTLMLQWSGQDPAVTLDNLSFAHGNAATITWPTADGQQTQILTPGNPLTLNGIVGS